MQGIFQAVEPAPQRGRIELGLVLSDRPLLDALLVVEIARGKRFDALPSGLQMREGRLAVHAIELQHIVLGQEGPALFLQGTLVGIVAVGADVNVRAVTVEDGEYLLGARCGGVLHGAGRSGDVFHLEDAEGIDVTLAHVLVVDVHEEEALQLDARATEGVGLEGHVVQVDFLDLPSWP